MVEEKYTSGVKIRQIKRCIDKFNNYLTEENKRNYYERNRYNLLESDFKYTLKSRIDTLNMYSLLPDIEKMGFHLFYIIDELDGKNSDFIFSLPYGQIRGKPISTPYRYRPSNYTLIKEHKKINDLMNKENEDLRLKIRPPLVEF